MVGAEMGADLWARGPASRLAISSAELYGIPGSLGVGPCGASRGGF